MQHVPTCFSYSPTIPLATLGLIGCAHAANPTNINSHQLYYVFRQLGVFYIQLMCVYVCLFIECTVSTYVLDVCTCILSVGMRFGYIIYALIILIRVSPSFSEVYRSVCVS